MRLMIRRVSVKIFQIRNSTEDFLVFTKQNDEEGIDV